MPGADVKICNLSVVFNKNTPNEVIAIEDISLEVDAGEITVIMGDNGSGKSTLLKAIAGIVKPCYGNILLDGRDITYAPYHHTSRDICFVHQDPLIGTCPNLTLHENILLYEKSRWWLPLPYSLSPARHSMKILSSILPGFKDRTSTTLHHFSGGQRQAIAIAMAFSRLPKLILLDEFTASLDSDSTSNVISFIKTKMAKQTIMMVTHNKSIANKLDCKTVILDNGRIGSIV